MPGYDLRTAPLRSDKSAVALEWRNQGSVSGNVRAVSVPVAAFAGVMAETPELGPVYGMTSADTSEPTGWVRLFTPDDLRRATDVSLAAHRESWSPTVGWIATIVGFMAFIVAPGFLAWQAGWSLGQFLATSRYTARVRTGESVQRSYDRRQWGYWLLVAVPLMAARVTIVAQFLGGLIMGPELDRQTVFGLPSFTARVWEWGLSGLPGHFPGLTIWAAVAFLASTWWIDGWQWRYPMAAGVSVALVALAFDLPTRSAGTFWPIIGPIPFYCAIGYVAVKVAKHGEAAWPDSPLAAMTQEVSTLLDVPISRVVRTRLYGEAHVQYGRDDHRLVVTEAAEAGLESDELRALMIRAVVKGRLDPPKTTTVVPVLLPFLAY